MQLTKDDLPAIGVSRLRATGVITSGMTSVELAFTQDGETVRRTVKLVERKFPNGGAWSFFLCPQCGRRARTLRLLDGRALCHWCDGLPYRCTLVSKIDNSERIRRLEALLSKPARLNTKKRHTLDRRSRLTASLRRAIVIEERNALKRAHAKPEPDPS